MECWVYKQNQLGSGLGKNLPSWENMSISRQDCQKIELVRAEESAQEAFLSAFFGAVEGATSSGNVLRMRAPMILQTVTSANGAAG